MSGNQLPFDANKKLTERLTIDFALQAAGLGVWEIDIDTNQVFWDDRCRALVGVDKATSIPFEQAIQYIHPDDLARVLAALEWAMKPASGGLFDESYRTVGDDGKLRWVRFWGQGSFRPTNELYRFAGVAQDVSEQVLARQKLAESEAHLELLRDTMPAMIFYLDAEQRYQSYNTLFMNWFGVDNTEAIGKTVREFIGEESYTKVLPYLTKAYAGEQVQYELYTPSRMAVGRWLNIVYTPHKTATGDLVGVIVHSTDITQSKRTEIDLRRSEARYRDLSADLEQQVIQRTQELQKSQVLLTSIFEQAPVAIALLEGPDYQIKLANDSMYAIWQLPPDHEPVLGQPVFEAFPGIAGLGLEGLLDQVRRTGLAISGNEQPAVFFRNGQSTTVYINFVYAPIYSVDGQVDVVVVANEVTEQVLARKQSEESEERYRLLSEELEVTNEQLAAANEELASSNEEYSALNEELEENNRLLIRSNDNLQKFAYVASHDLQEPLRKIQQFGDLLKTRYADTTGNELGYLERMQSAASRMSTLIKDLLTFSRISTQRERDTLVPLGSIVQDVLTDLELVIQEKGAVIQVGPLPTVNGDAMQLGQLFQNLLSNALKFQQTDAAGVLIPPVIHITAGWLAADNLPARAKPARMAPAYYWINVADNGIGFDEKYTDRIFQVFQRLHGKGSFTGTGIGLAICEKVVINHGGSIVATSQVGQGATFSVYLPV